MCFGEGGRLERENPEMLQQQQHHPIPSVLLRFDAGVSPVLCASANGFSVSLFSCLECGGKEASQNKED